MLLTRWFDSIVLYFFYRAILRITCQHFCVFKEGGSNFEYTHVHIMGEDKAAGLNNPQGITGIGHDDRTNEADPKHNTVSRGSTCEFVTKPDGKAVDEKDYNAKYFFDVYFQAADPELPCPEG